MFSDFIDLVKNKTTLLILLLIGVLVSIYAGKLVYNRETDEFIFLLEEISVIKYRPYQGSYF